MKLLESTIKSIDQSLKENIRIKTADKVFGEFELALLDCPEWSDEETNIAGCRMILFVWDIIKEELLSPEVKEKTRALLSENIIGKTEVSHE